MKRILLIPAILLKYKTQTENLLSLIGIQVLNTLIPLFLFPYLVKTLGPVQYGQTAFVMSLINFLQIIVDFGFNYTGTRAVALADNTHSRSALFFGVLAVKLLLFIICMAVLGAAALLILKIRTALSLFLISSGLLFGNILFPVWFFQGMEKMKFISALNFVIRIISCLLIVLLVKSPVHTERYIIINTVSYLIPGTFAFIYCIYSFKLIFIFPSVANIKETLLDGYNLFLSNLIIGGYSSIRVFVVGLFCSGSVLGLYSILDRIYFIIQTIPLTSFLQATYPKFVKEIKDNKQKVINFMRVANKVINLYFITAVVMFLLLEHWLLQKVLNLDLPANFFYLSSILGCTLILINSNTLKLEFLLISGNDKLYRSIHFITGIIGSITLVAFTYKWGVFGCAISLLLSQILIVVYTIWLYKKRLGFVL